MIACVMNCSNRFALKLQSMSVTLCSQLQLMFHNGNKVAIRQSLSAISL